MASRRNSISEPPESNNGALSATPRPGGYVKITSHSQKNGNGTEKKSSEDELSFCRAKLLRSIQTFYSPKTRRTASKTSDVPPCGRKLTPCLPSCTSITAASSGSEEEDLPGTDSASFPVCQDGDLNNILGVVISTVMVLADGKHSCSNDHLLWTAHFLETIKDEHGRMPPNVAGILNYIKYIRLKEEEKGSDENKTEGKDKSSKDDEEKKGEEEAKTSAADDDGEAKKSSDAPDTAGKSEDRPPSADSAQSEESRKSGESGRGTEDKKKERRRSSDSSNGSGGRRRSSLEGGGSRRSSRVSFEDELPTRGENKTGAKKGKDDDAPPPLIEEH